MILVELKPRGKRSFLSSDPKYALIHLTQASYTHTYINIIYKNQGQETHIGILTHTHPQAHTHII